MKRFVFVVHVSCPIADGNQALAVNELRSARTLAYTVEHITGKLLSASFVLRGTRFASHVERGCEFCCEFAVE